MKRLLILAAVLLYVLSPLDLIPDVIPVGGQCDDILALLAGCRALFGKKP